MITSQISFRKRNQTRERRNVLTFNEYDWRMMRILAGDWWICDVQPFSFRTDWRGKNLLNKGYGMERQISCRIPSPRPPRFVFFFVVCAWFVRIFLQKSANFDFDFSLLAKENFANLIGGHFSFINRFWLVVLILEFVRCSIVRRFPYHNRM